MTSPRTATAIFAGGCFWCVQSDLEKIPEVISVVSGYSGGTTDKPTYENYAGGGHREVVEVTYDPTKTTYRQLVHHLLRHTDPTDAGGSFADRGESYSPAVYYSSEEERKVAEEVIKEIEDSGRFSEPLAVAVEPRQPFWPAEEYHQDYATKNPEHYKAYRVGSGREAFIQKHWGEEK
jgi:methionine-S-sulfoxide reductase